jgi:hypothetical protein
MNLRVMSQDEIFNLLLEKTKTLLGAIDENAGKEKVEMLTQEVREIQVELQERKKSAN